MSKVVYDFLKTAKDEFVDSVYGSGVRCSAYLTDDTYLPCVIIRESEKIVDLAIKRFEEEKKGKGIFSKDEPEAYRKIVKNFLCSKSQVASYNIARLDESKFAFPKNLLDILEGETTMSWTGFVLEMNDGKIFQYGTSFLVEFFDLPDGYTFNDVSKLHNHSYINTDGVLKPHSVPFFDIPEDYDRSKSYRERPYFVCYKDDL